MRSCTHKLLRLGLLAALLLASTGHAAAPLSELKLFKSTPMGQGLWRMELISSDDPQMARGAAVMGQTGLCLDVAKELSRNTPANDSRCTPQVLRNTESQAEIEVSCKDGGGSRMLMTRESEKSYLMDTTVSKDGKQRNFKVRYTHAGACKGDTMMQFDRNSPMCKQMDPARMLARCTSLPESARAQCEQQMKGLAAACQ